MRIPVSISRFTLAAALSSAFLVVGQPTARADDLFPTTFDWLKFVEQTKMRVVYIKPGASLKQYNHVMILDVNVAFKKNWQRDYNRNAAGSARRVTQKDMDDIKKRLATGFRTVFTGELQKVGYEVVNTAANDVLVLKPAIINLVVTAPDKKTAGRSRTYVASAGEMTLYVEMRDSLTNDIIALVIDPQKARDRGNFRISSSVTNRAEADRILKKWADILSSLLSEVRKAN